MSQQTQSKPKWFGHPALIVVLAIVLVVDLASIEKHQFGDSIVRDAVLGWSDGRPPAAHGRGVPGIAVREDGGITWIWPTDPEFEDSRSDFNTQLVHVSIFRDLIQREGFYHLTRKIEEFFLWPEDLAAEDQQAVFDAILVAIEREPEYEILLRFVPDLIRAGVRRRVSPIYGGYVRNGLAWLLVASLIVCCTLGKPWLWRPRVFDERWCRLHQGLCGDCGYDLTGLKEGAVCPECGAKDAEDH